MRTTFFLLSAVLLTACQMDASQQQMEAPKSLEATQTLIVHDTFACGLQNTPRATGGAPEFTPDISGLRDFVLLRMLLPDEPNRFGLRGDSGMTVGVGNLQSDGRWVIDQWKPMGSSSPDATLATLFPDGQILLSLKAGSNAHVTYGATCRGLI